ncbi:MAG TPA: enoyl-CoA hydratase/isomerase family protein [Candidatus Kryptonia bacterium]|nr:enoyl-CoA hydratase/isomerase family protein [Candidatus Kryptonia bacterium]
MMASPRRTSATPPLRTTVRDGVAWLRLDRPAAGNAVSQALAQAICTTVERLELDDSIVLVVIEGAGEQFCAGVDDGGQWERQCDWIAAIARLTVPVVAAIDGDAIAEGFELALACDIRIASERARLQLPQLSRGRLPSHGGTQRLPRIIGRMRALDLLLTARALGASEAAEIGLVARVFPAQTFADDVQRFVGELAQKGPIALRYAKEAVLQSLDLTLDQGIRLEQDLYVLLQTTADRAEGVRAFLEKRRPKFNGS